MPVQTAIQVRRGTASSWTSTNPTLAAGEIGFETDTSKFKIGTGSTAWNSLNYFVQDPVTTKGDLYTFSTTDARLAVGNNGETLVADSSQSTGLRWGSNYGFTAGKNKLINGDFRINQRSFTSTTTNATFGFDRWRNAFSGGTVTMSAQTFTPGTAPVAGYEGINFLRLETASQSASSNFASVVQKIEDVRTFAGQTVTVSFWAKANSGTPKVGIVFEQIFGTGGSVAVAVNGGDVTISTSWTRYTKTVNIPSVSGKTISTSNDSTLIAEFWTSAGSNYAGTYSDIGLQNTIIDFWGVQIETGNVATAFQTATGTLAGEFAAASRYYYRLNGSAGNAQMGQGLAYNTTGVQVVVNVPVAMRIYPTAIDFTSIHLTDNVNIFAITGLTLSADGGSNNTFNLNATGATGLTQYRGYILRGNALPNYIGFSAEL